MEKIAVMVTFDVDIESLAKWLLLDVTDGVEGYFETKTPGLEWKKVSKEQQKKIIVGTLKRIIKNLEEE